MSALIMAFLVYLVVVIAIGCVTSRSAKNQSEFLLGGQRIPGWAITISERASGESAWLLLGLTGAALTVGLGEIWTVIGCVAGIIFLWFFIGERFRRELNRYDAITVPEFMAQRFNDKTNNVRWLASLIIIFFFTFYVAAQMVGAGKILQKTGIITEAWGTMLTPEVWGIVLGAVIVIGYTLIGGFRAVVWTDLLQGLIMIIALVVLPIVGFIELQAQNASVGSALMAVGPEKADWFAGKQGMAAVSLLLGGFAWGLGYMGQPHLLVRFMALPDPDEVPKLRWLAGGWTILAYGGAFAIGLIGLALYGGEFFAGDAEKIMPALATNLLPGWFAGIIISGAVAAMMSTADSQLLVVTSAFSEDITRRIFRKELSPRAQVTLSRVITFLVGGIAFAMALGSRDTVYEMVSYAWSGLGASFGPVILMTLIWRRFACRGALSTMLTGTLVTIIWKQFAALDALVSHRLVAWVAALLVGVIVTLATAKKESD
ncbi:MAG: sodium/proline symporter [bacterium]|nr:sodium/proline symporter [bacterium]